MKRKICIFPIILASWPSLKSLRCSRYNFLLIRIAVQVALGQGVGLGHPSVTPLVSVGQLTRCCQLPHICYKLHSCHFFLRPQLLGARADIEPQLSFPSRPRRTAGHQSPKRTPSKLRKQKANQTRLCTDIFGSLQILIFEMLFGGPDLQLGTLWVGSAAPPLTSVESEQGRFWPGACRRGV